VLARLIARYLQQVQLPEAITVIAAATVLLLAAVIASVAPAARAARIDVMRALRAD
jgi:ABC-type lipoprotein release transport system permease subunit